MHLFAHWSGHAKQWPLTIDKLLELSLNVSFHSFICHYKPSTPQLIASVQFLHHYTCLWQPGETGLGPHTPSTCAGMCNQLLLLYIIWQPVQSALHVDLLTTTAVFICRAVLCNLATMFVNTPSGLHQAALAFAALYSCLCTCVEQRGVAQI